VILPVVQYSTHGCLILSLSLSGTQHYMSQVQEQKSQYEADMSKFKEAKGAILVAPSADAEAEVADDNEDASEGSDAESSVRTAKPATLFDN
jgi:hypothetical protein